jgi:surfeit locus 1 family protein
VTATDATRLAAHGASRTRVGTVAALIGVAILIALGVWQLERRSWKLDLIDRVEQRVHAPAVAAPGPAAWPSIGTAQDEYRHVSASGHFMDAPATLVQAVTELGGGYWVLAPFRTADGFTILVNRGFVPPDRRDVPASDEAIVTGLLRLTEPKGGFLRANDPGQDRWHSRDTAAIAAARGFDDVAPYFIDEDAGTDPAAFPRGGLTVIDFPNNHLVYALTWFGLALMLAVMTIGARFGKRLPSHKTDLS